MTVTSSATWTCDRCKKVEVRDLKQLPQSPLHWIEVLFQPAQLVRTNPSRSQTSIGHLCNECGGLLVSFVKGTLEKDLESVARQEAMMKELNADCLWAGADLGHGGERLVIFQASRLNLRFPGTTMRRMADG